MRFDNYLILSHKYRNLLSQEDDDKYNISYLFNYYFGGFKRTIEEDANYEHDLLFLDIKTNRRYVMDYSSDNNTYRSCPYYIIPENSIINQDEDTIVALIGMRTMYIISIKNGALIITKYSSVPSAYNNTGHSELCTEVYDREALELILTGDLNFMNITNIFKIIASKAIIPDAKFEARKYHSNNNVCYSASDYSREMYSGISDNKCEHLIPFALDEYNKFLSECGFDKKEENGLKLNFSKKEEN